MAIGYGTISITDLTDKDFQWNLLKDTANKFNGKTTSASASDYYKYFATDYELIVGETYTFSLDLTVVSGSAQLYVTCGCGSTGYQKDIPGWISSKISSGTIKYILTHTITASDLDTASGRIHFAFRVRNDKVASTYTIDNVKLELGEVTATEWAPHPDDLAVSVLSTTYQAGASNTTPPTGSWSSAPVIVSQGQYLWTRVEYTDGKVSYSVARQGQDGHSPVVTA